MRLGFAGRVGAVFGERIRRQRWRPRDQFAGHHAFGSAVADAMLDARDLTRMPSVEKIAEDAAVAAEFTVVVAGAFPDAQRGEVRRPQRAGVPLVHGVIGDAVDADFAVAPALRAGPLDAFVNVLRLSRRPDIEHAGRASGAARVDAHAGIAVRHPFFGIDQFPILILVARALQHFGRRLDEARPLALVAFLERQPFGVGAVTQNDRILSVAKRPEHVRTQNDTVVHADGRVPIDLHAVAHFTLCKIHRTPVLFEILYHRIAQKFWQFGEIAAAGAVSDRRRQRGQRAARCRFRA